MQKRQHGTGRTGHRCAARPTAHTHQRWQGSACAWRGWRRQRKALIRRIATALCAAASRCRCSAMSVVSGWYRRSMSSLDAPQCRRAVGREPPDIASLSVSEHHRIAHECRQRHATISLTAAKPSHEEVGVGVGVGVGANASVAGASRTDLSAWIKRHRQMHPVTAVGYSPWPPALRHGACSAPDAVVPTAPQARQQKDADRRNKPLPSTKPSETNRCDAALSDSGSQRDR